MPTPPPPHPTHPPHPSHPHSAFQLFPSKCLPATRPQRLCNDWLMRSLANEQQEDVIASIRRLGRWRAWACVVYFLCLNCGTSSLSLQTMIISCSGEDGPRAPFLLSSSSSSTITALLHQPKAEPSSIVITPLMSPRPSNDCRMIV